MSPAAIPTKGATTGSTTPPPVADLPPARWTTALLLHLLHKHQCGMQNTVFSNLDLQRWVGKQLTPEQRTSASSRLCALGFLHPRSQFVKDGPTMVYTVTAEGAAAIAQAGTGHVRKSGPKGHRTPPAPNPGALTTRLWALVRMRRVVDAESAARTLCDAGDPAAFARMRTSVAKALRRWELAGALQARAKRLQLADQADTSNGVKGYVLVADSPTPPNWSQAAKARAAQAKASPATAA